MLLDANQSSELPLELLKGIGVVRLDFDLLDCHHLVIVAALVDLSSATAANDLQQFYSM